MIRALYYPVMVFGAVAAWLVASRHVSADQLPLLNLAISAVVIPLVILSERLLPFHRDWLRGRGDFVADVVASLVVLPVIVALAEALDRAALPTLELLPTDSHVVVEVVVALVLAEFMHFWVHRLAHHWAPMWRLHAVHHGAPRVYWGNAGRFHPLDLAVIFPLYFAPVVLLGISPQAFSLFMVMNAVTGILEHANVDFRAGPLNYLFNSAELHRFHHANDVVTSRHNYGKVLCIWDLVFGTHKVAPGGFAGELGAGQPVPVTFFAQLAHPFVARAPDPKPPQETA